MRAVDVIDRMLALLAEPEEPTAGTSMRLPVALREAAALAVRHLELAPSTTALAVSALRTTLETAVMQAALDAHYAEHPALRPTLADLAVAAAEQDGHPFAKEPERLARAAVEVARHRPDADADDVLLWADARSLGAMTG